MKKQPESKHPTKGSGKEAAKKTARVVEMKGKPQPRPPAGAGDPAYAQAVQQYQDGLRLLQERKFEKARTHFEKAIASGIAAIADRAAVHLNTCNQHIAKQTTTFKSPEEHYDYAVSLMNVGEYVEAREHLEQITRQAPKADYAIYGMAVLSCLMNRGEEALQYLSQAIRMNPANRLQARNDTDFRNLADDPRFTELLYPETTEPSGMMR